MKRHLLLASLLAVLPFTVHAHTGPFVGESCGVGSDCSYNVSGKTYRVISMSNLNARSTYTCNTISGDGLDKLSIDNIIPSSPDISVTLNAQGNLASNPFMTVITGNTDNVSVTYNLRNNDNLFMDHNVVYVCKKTN